MLEDVFGEDHVERLVWKRNRVQRAKMEFAMEQRSNSRIEIDPDNRAGVLELATHIVLIPTATGVEDSHTGSHQTRKLLPVSPSCDLPILPRLAHHARARALARK